MTMMMMMIAASMFDELVLEYISHHVLCVLGGSSIYDGGLFLNEQVSLNTITLSRFFTTECSSERTIL